MQIDVNDIGNLVSCLAALCGKGGKVHAKAWVNGGACPGTVGSRIVRRESKYADECDVFGLVVEAYAANRCEVDLASDAGKRKFARVFTEAVKRLVVTGHNVNLANRFAFEPSVYSDKNGRKGKAYMKVYGCSRDFNSLDDLEVELERSPAFSEKLREARKAERQTAYPESVGRVTLVHCPKCGTEIVIANSEEAEGEGEGT